METHSNGEIISRATVRQIKALSLSNPSNTAVEARQLVSPDGLRMDPGLWMLSATKLINDGLQGIDLSKATCGSCIYRGTQDDGSGVNNLTVCRRLPPSPECVENASDFIGGRSMDIADPDFWAGAGVTWGISGAPNYYLYLQTASGNVRQGPFPTGRYVLSFEYQTLNLGATGFVALYNSAATTAATVLALPASAAWSPQQITLEIGVGPENYIGFGYLHAAGDSLRIRSIALEYIYDSRARWNQINTTDWCGEWRRSTAQILSGGDDRVWFRLADDRSTETNWTNAGGIVIPGPPGEPLLWEEPRFLEVEGRPSIFAALPPWTRLNASLVGPRGRE